MCLVDRTFAWSVVFFLMVIAAASPVLAQQSTTGPMPPPGIDRGLQPPSRATVVLDVPFYLWHHGCGPTAAGMVIGYWAENGYEPLTAYGVNAMIAGDHGDSTCGAPIADHYHDYACPIDGGSLIPDKSELGGAHGSNCLADFMRTSWSAAYNRYGWSWFSDLGFALLAYPPYANPGYTFFRMEERSFWDMPFSDYMAEIDAGRPTVFLVDTDGNGSTDHFVTGVGYAEDPPQYAIHDTWDGSVHWFPWRAMGSGVGWGIYGAHFFGPGAGFFANPRTGDVPLAVQFSGQSFDPAEEWMWDFGDGGSAAVRSPAHEFTAPGMYDVALRVVCGSDTVPCVREDFIIALADTLGGSDGPATAFNTVEVVVSAVNTVPLQEIRIPLSYAGSLDLTLESFSTVGCRTSYFESTGYIQTAPSRKQAVIYLVSSTHGTSPELPAGSGPIVKFTFTTAEASVGDSAVIDLSGYSTYLPMFMGPLLTYNPKIASPILRFWDCCEGERGDIDGNATINISDVTFLIAYFFRDGTPPACPDEADCDGSGVLNIADLTYEIAYLFRSGPGPLPCP